MSRDARALSQDQQHFSIYYFKTCESADTCSRSNKYLNINIKILVKKY